MFLITGILTLHAQIIPPEIVAFGDSLSDTGNKSDATNTAAESGMGIGGVWVVQLAAMYGQTLTQSSSGGTDYAQGGAVTSGLTNQVNSYLNKNSGSASSTALYTFSAGGNDILNNLKNNPDTVAVTAADNIESQINSLVNAGAKNFLWLNMFPINLTPDVYGNATVAEAVSAFNIEWTADVAALRSEHPNIDLVGLDFYGFALNLGNNSAALGFTNTTQAWNAAKASVPYSKASSNPDSDKFVFWDNLHPTTHVDQLLAEDAYNALQVPEPASWALLALGLGGGGAFSCLRRTRSKGVRWVSHEGVSP